MPLAWFSSLALWSVLGLGVTQPESEPTAEDTFAPCEEQMAQSPELYESASCFRALAASSGKWQEALRRLAAHQERYPDNYWITLVRGHLEKAGDPDRVEGLYREAAEGFKKQGDARGQVFARYNLRNLIFGQGRVADAEAEMLEVVAVAEVSKEPNLIARAMTLKAFHFAETGHNLAEARRSLKRAQAIAFPDGAYTMRRSILSALANLNFRLGEFDQAVSQYRQLVELTREEGDQYHESIYTANEGAARQTLLEELPSAEGKKHLIGLMDESLALAGPSNNWYASLVSHVILGQVLGADDEQRAQSHLRKCIALAKEAEQPRDRAHCSWSLGRRLARTDPARARALADEGLAIALDGDNLWTIAYGWRERLGLSWLTNSRNDAIRDSFAALEAIESIRELQKDSEARAGLFSAWTREYYQLSGRLLEPIREGEELARDDLERAFHVTERMRGRVLLEALALTDSDPVHDLSSHPDGDKRRRSLEAIVAIQRKLLDPRQPESVRGALLPELERQELEERRLRELIHSSSAPGLPSVEFESLSAIEQTLRENEAMLVFQIGLWEDLYGQFGGGSWLLRITREGTSVYPLPDRTKLAVSIPIFANLFSRQDAREARPASELYRDILAPALEGLPEEIEHLIILPDKDLYSLPFAALRASADGPPLGSLFQISIAPSASLWARWRRDDSTVPPAVLAIADPAFGNLTTSAAAEERGWTTPGSAIGLGSLGRLPNARKEGRSVLKHIRAGELLVGEEANEATLKSSALDRFGILHFASHAVADAQRPERSAMLLAAGAEGEDGLLQAREIGDLSLRGRLVVLSACRSATGQLLSGEGVIGLSRAFFKAGAQAVVGSLWPLRDDHAAFIFESFYRNLATGVSVAQAMRHAQREAIEAALPASAWAGLLVLGDGSFRPILQPIPPARFFEVYLRQIGLGAFLLLLLSFLFLRRRSA